MKFHSASYRCHGLSVLENLELYSFIEITAIILQMILMRTSFLDYPIADNELTLIMVLLDLIRCMQTKEIPNTVRRIYKCIKIENFSEVFCKEKFGFLKADLPKLLKVLKLSDKTFLLKNKSKVFVCAIFKSILFILSNY